MRFSRIALQAPQPRSTHTGGHGAADWHPLVDVTEHDDRYVLAADLPGVAPDAIDINMQDGVLTIAGARAGKRDAGDNTVRSHRAERRSGRFSRRFALPAKVNADAITARSAFGTLEVVIPKLPEVQPRRVAVDAA